MPISIDLNGEGAFKDLALDNHPNYEKIIHLPNAHIQIVALDKGTFSGRPSACLRIDLPQGKSVLAEFLLRELIVAAKTFESAYFSNGLDAGRV